MWTCFLGGPIQPMTLSPPLSSLLPSTPSLCSCTFLHEAFSQPDPLYRYAWERHPQGAALGHSSGWGAYTPQLPPSLLSGRLPSHLVLSTAVPKLSLWGGPPRLLRDWRHSSLLLPAAPFLPPLPTPLPVFPDVTS